MVARYLLSPEYRDQLAHERRAAKMARQERQGSPPAGEAAEPGGENGCQSFPTRPWPPLGRLCGYCLAPLANGSRFCGDECREGMFRISCQWPAD